MSKKTDKATFIGEQIGVNKLKNTLTRDIDVMGEAFKISGENDQLAYHISKMKGFANKYFGCCYKTHDEDFAVFSIPKAEKLINKVLEKGLQTFAKAEESQPQLDALEQIETQSTETNDILEESKKTNEEINKTLDESDELRDAVKNYWSSMNNKRKGMKIEERGDGWTKQVIGGRLELVYDKPKVLTRAKAEDIKTGVVHTHETLMSAKDPIEYLSSIQVGDEIRVKYKGGNCDTAQGIVASIQSTEKAFAPTRYKFILNGYGEVTHKDFA